MVRSKEFKEGYDASSMGISLNRNPYLDQLRIPHPDDLEITLSNKQYDDWREGWKAKFYGEPIDDDRP